MKRIKSGMQLRGVPRFDRVVSVGLRIVYLEFWQERGAVDTVEKLYAIVQINAERQQGYRLTKSLEENIL